MESLLESLVTDRTGVARYRARVVWDCRFFPGVYTPGFMIPPLTGLRSAGWNLLPAFKRLAL